MKKLRTIKDLQQDAKNANSHTAKGKKLLEKSLKDLGAGRSILADKDGKIIAGNATAEQAAALGFKKIRVVETTGDELVVVQRTDLALDSAKGRKLAILDNRVAEIDLSWNAEALASFNLNLGEMFDEKALRGFGLETKIDAPEPQIDKADHLQKKWKTKRGQIWQVGEHRLMCGDSTITFDTLKLLHEVKPEIVFTSFPYAVGLKYRSYEDNIANLRDLLDRTIPLLTRMTAEGAFCIVNFGDIVSAKGMLKTEDVCEYPMALEYWPRFRDAGWLLHTRRVWVKPIGATVCPWTAQSSRGSTEWEHVWTWKKSGDDRSHRSPTSQFGVWHYSKFEYETDVTADHKGAFPCYLPGAAIEIYTDKGMTVWEPFLGSGSTMCAAQALERRCFGMEIDPGYAAVALERMADMGLKPKLL